MEFVPGRIVAGRFVLERKLGEGGMGVVWAARHTVTRKAVALKVLKGEKAGDAVVRQRFVREARTASTVQHPNIIEIRDVIELEDGAPAMVMDLLEGESLGALLEREPRLPIERVAPIMLQVVSAVGAAHAAGVVHRDLKPDNIFLVRQDGGVAVRVLDFGIAKVLPGGGDVSNGLTNTGAMLGTPYYMSPEQIFGERSVGPAADVWAIGVILYECLGGKRPTEAENLGQILRIITTEEIPSLRDVAPDVPPDVAAMVDRMLRRDRELRPRSLLGIFDGLSRYAPHCAAPSFAEPSSMTAAPPSPESTGSSRAIVPSDSDAHPTAATLASTTAASMADRPAGVPGARSIRRLLPLLIGGLALVSLAGAFLASTSRQAPGTPATVSAQPAATSVSPAWLPPAPPSTTATIEAPAESASTAVAGSASATARPRPPRARPAAPPTTPPAPSSASPVDPTPHPSPYDHL